jgi:hypothetical protein
MVGLEVMMLLTGRMDMAVTYLTLLCTTANGVPRGGGKKAHG